MATGEVRCEEAEVVVVGAGIAGLATALALKRVGAERVVVLERAPGLRVTGAALVLFPNAWRALAALRVAHKLIPLYPALQNGQITDITTGAAQEVSLGKASSSEGMEVRPVHRKVLLESLSEELPPGTIRFSTNVTSISTRAPMDASSGAVLHMEDGTAIRDKADVHMVSQMECEDEEEQLYNLLLFLLLCRMYWYYQTYFVRSPVYEDSCRGHSVVHEMVNGHWRQCYSTCRLYPDIFKRLCAIFRERGLLCSSRFVSLEEQMRIFLQILAHNQWNLNMCDILHHSTETISKYFHRVLNAFCAWAPDMIRPHVPLEDIPTHVKTYAGGKYWPFLKNAIGALDGTHISANIPLAKQLAYRCGRDGKRCTQNVLAVCDFDMHFTFIAAGWEGTAHDAKILADSVHNVTNNFPVPPGENFYLVDARYVNRKGFLAPYKNVRYHIPDFQQQSARGKDEQFNRLHSSLRNVIERSFGLLKRRWTILNNMPSYSYVTQVKTVVVAVVLHNFLVDMRMHDALYETFADEEVFEATQTGVQEDASQSTTPDSSMDDMARVRDSIRDEITTYRGY